MLEKLRQGMDVERDNNIPPEIAAKYKKVFSGVGADVLADMLKDLGMFAVCKTQDEVARRNYATQLLVYLDIIRPDASGQIPDENIKKVTKRLLERE